jgi:hypothetical protein
VALNPCPLTDGDFTTPIPAQTEPACPSGSTCDDARANHWAYVDLGSAKTISLVVVRGVSYASVVETSTDATNWTPLPGNAQSATFSVTVPSGPAVRYVRIRAASTRDRISGLSEVSVW